MSENLAGLVPGAPQLFAAPQVTVQPQFLPGSIEAEIEAECERRGWSWHLIAVMAQQKIALMRREPEPLLGETVPEVARMDYSKNFLKEPV